MDDVKSEAEQVAAPAPAPVETPKPEESRFQQRIDQLTAARRSAEERARLAEERLAQAEMQRRAQVVPVRQAEQTIGQMSRDDWDAWHAEDPAAANRYLVQVEGNAIAQNYIAQIQQMEAMQKQQNAYQESVGDVFKVHPELKECMDNETKRSTTPFWQVYDEVSREMPDARFLAKGPYIVMKEAERRMKEKEAAEREKQIAAQAAQQESERQTRVGASHTLGQTASKPSGAPVKLTPEEEKVARKMGMTPEEYAKFRK